MLRLSLASAVIEPDQVRPAALDLARRVAEANGVD